MNRVAIEEFKLFGRRWSPRLDQPSTFCVDPERALGTDNLHRKGIKELIGEYDLRRIRTVAGTQFGFSGFEVAAESDLNPFPQGSRLLVQHITQSPKEIREFSLRPIEHILREQAAAGTEFSERDLFRRSQQAPHFFELPRQQAPEDRVHIAGSIEIAGFPELRGVSRIIAEFRIVEAQLHIPREGNRPALANLLLDLLAKSVHSPFRRRSARSWGVRMNISTK